MTPIELVDCLVEFFEEVVQNYALATKTGDTGKPPAVYAGYLPPKGKINSSEFPFIIVRYLDEDDEEVDEVKIGVIIGCYSEDEQNGWRDPLNIATRLKLELRKKVVFGPYALGRKIRIELFEDQPVPNWYAVMEMAFDIPKAQIDWSEHGFDFEKD
ncbi:Hypothetical protein DPCES_1410 [Desulfitobacterium hafniense]|uniref:Uncharacterized protein n=1 Tax=Desulfitobacterium hafniense TaxID=49338 RepID=A0A098AYW4_DESHA|nr:hypothetical protein [Desulfitobacterium hafniense]CDX01297.1 Hypothetical protein DPCES_1410 [Desulfitobacterium hafniense]